MSAIVISSGAIAEAKAMDAAWSSVTVARKETH